MYDYDLDLPEAITICEVGPRDGLQNEKQLLTTGQKLELIEECVQAGIKSIEIGSFVNPQAVPAMADTQAVAKGLRRFPNVEYSALVLNRQGLELAQEAGVNKVKLVVSASKSHSLANSNKTPAEVIKGFAECAEYAEQNGIKLAGALAVAFGCSFDGKIPVADILEILRCFYALGVKELSLSDTTGMGDPRLVYSLCQKVKACFPDVTWTLHFHNTRGMGLANVYAGMLAGVTHYDSCFAGLGGCPFVPGAAGNIATEDLANMCECMDVQTGTNLDKLLNLSAKVKKLVGHETDSFLLKAGK